MQDEGSQLLALLLDAKRGEMVVDFCAGAGGKTLAIGAAMRNTGRLYAFDTSAHRLDALKPRLARSGLSNVHPAAIAHERDDRIKRLAGKIDRVLVDAPCSGLGTLRRNPDLKWRQSPKAVEELVAKQTAILQSAARLLKPGGRLVYATCSVLPQENEGIAEAFTAANREFTPLVVGAIGLVTERFLVRPLYGRGIDYPLLLTFGLSWVLIEAMRVTFGIEGLPSSTPAALRGSVDLGFGFFPGAIVDQQQPAAAGRSGLQRRRLAICKPLEADAGLRRSEQRLAASESRWRALSDSSPLGVFHVDARGACTYTNERWQQIYGLSPDESLGTGWSSQVSERDRSTIGEAWRRAAEQGREFSCEFEVCRSDGSRPRLCSLRIAASLRWALASRPLVWSSSWRKVIVAKRGSAGGLPAGVRKARMSCTRLSSVTTPGPRRSIARYSATAVNTLDTLAMRKAVEGVASGQCGSPYE